MRVAGDGRSAGPGQWTPEDIAMSVPFRVSGLLSFWALERWFTNGRLTEKISQLLKPFYKVSVRKGSVGTGISAVRHSAACPGPG